MTEIIPGIYLVDGTMGCQVYLIVEDGITLIDTGMGKSDQAILKTIRELGFKPSDIKRIIITHHHIDHIGCLHAMQEATHATVMAGEADADVIEGKKPMTVPKMRFPIGLIGPLLLRVFKPKPAPVNVRLKGGEEIPVLGGLRVIGLPGHCPGNIGLYSPAKKLLFSSDTLRMKGDEFIKPLNYDVEPAQCLASIKKIGALDCEIILSGHDHPILSGASKRVAAYADILSKE